MKGLLLTVATLALISSVAGAQIVLLEDFETTPDTLFGTCATLPAGWISIDEDGRFPDPTVDWIAEAWCLSGDPDVAMNEVAVSTSWYAPAGAADDWLITPQFEVPADYPRLRWSAEAQDPGFPDGYEVRISTNAPVVADFLANPVLITIPAETGGVMTPRELDLMTYAGQTVYIAWRNTSNDQFMLFVDNVLIQGGYIFMDGFESGDTTAWSSTL